MKKRNVLVLIALVSLMLLACVGSGAVKKVAEPIDKQGCKIDCKELEFYSYDYPTHTCKCKTKNGSIITLYDWEK